MQYPETPDTSISSANLADHFSWTFPKHVGIWQHKCRRTLFTYSPLGSWHCCPTKLSNSSEVQDRRRNLLPSVSHTCSDLYADLHCCSLEFLARLIVSDQKPVRISASDKSRTANRVCGLSPWPLHCSENRFKTNPWPNFTYVEQCGLVLNRTASTLPYFWSSTAMPLCGVNCQKLVPEKNDRSSAQDWRSLSPLFIL